MGKHAERQRAECATGSTCCGRLNGQEAHAARASLSPVQTRVSALFLLRTALRGVIPWEARTSCQLFAALSTAAPSAVTCDMPWHGLQQIEGFQLLQQALLRKRLQIQVDVKSMIRHRLPTCHCALLSFSARALLTAPCSLPWSGHTRRTMRLWRLTSSDGDPAGRFQEHATGSPVFTAANQQRYQMYGITHAKYEHNMRMTGHTEAACQAPTPLARAARYDVSRRRQAALRASRR